MHVHGQRAGLHQVSGVASTSLELVPSAAVRTATEVRDIVFEMVHNQFASRPHELVAHLASVDQTVLDNPSTLVLYAQHVHTHQVPSASYSNFFEVGRQGVMMFTAGHSYHFAVVIRRNVAHASASPAVAIDGKKRTSSVLTVTDSDTSTTSAPVRL